MTEKQKMIEKLKKTWTVFKGLSPEEREFLQANKKEVIIVAQVGPIGPMSTIEFNCPLAVYRLCADFKAPAEGRWVEYPIYRSGIFWMCHATHMNTRVALGDAPAVVGFGGVQFKEQAADKKWSMYVTAFLGEKGGIYQQSNTDTLATPLKVRFWVEG